MVKSSRSKYDDDSISGNPISGWVRFWFTPANPIGLHLVRVLTGLLLLAWLLPLAGDLNSLFGLQGWFDEQAYKDAARLDVAPKPLGWSLLFLVGTSSQGLTAFYWVSIAVIILFTFGIWSRLTAVLTWLIVASFTANPAMEFDADAILLILSFYCMVGYVLFGQRHDSDSWAYRLLGGRDAWLLGQKSPEGGSGHASLAANIALRLLQVHMAVVILTSGLHKLQFGEWWAGYAFWYPLFPPFESTLKEAQALTGLQDLFFFVLSAAAYATLAWQIGFPLYAWRPRWWRTVLLGGAFVGMLGTMFLYRIPLFGQAVFVGCLAFVTAEEWQALFTLLPRLPGLHWLEGKLPVVDEDVDEPADKHEAPEPLATVGH